MEKILIMDDKTLNGAQMEKIKPPKFLLIKLLEKLSIH
jgi:hypothetical protein